MISRYISLWLSTVFLSIAVNSHAAGDQQFDWSVYDQLLRQHVIVGEKQNIAANLVDYKTLKTSKPFHEIASQLTAFNPEPLSTKQKIVFYINAYNYFALKLITDNYPLESIKDLGNIFFPVWKKDVGLINQKTVSLDYIEHTVLRSLGEPAIHFAIVCASLSCPDLRAEAYTEEKLSIQLRDQLITFLKQEKGKQITGEGEHQALYLSKIFQWFESDFEKSGGVINYLVEYDPSVKPFSDFNSLDYNWELNSQ